MPELSVRLGTQADIAPLDALLARTYPKLLAGDYPPSVLVTAIPIISHAQPKLVTCGTYYVAYIGDDLVGAGGWTKGEPGNPGRSQRNIGHIRHFATEVKRARQGVGRAVMEVVIKSARAAGVTRLDCLSTRTAVPFYESVGFITGGEVDIPLRPGITFPAVRMARRLAP